MNRETAYLAHDFARFYDWMYEDRTEDMPLYLEAARKHGPPLLELACGTGRLTIPLAREGHHITGLDTSPAMLEIARGKLAEEEPEVRQRVRLVQGDMVDFRLDEQFNLAFIPFASFFHLHTNEARASCMSCIHHHLAAGGAAIIDLVPATVMANQSVGGTSVTRSGISAATGKMTRGLTNQLSIDQHRQRVTFEHTYLEEESDGSESRFVFVEDYTWVTEDQMRGLLREAGFAEISVLGWYESMPFPDDAPRMIFVAQK